MLCGDAADDLVQTALVRALRSKRRVLAASDVDGYLYVLLVNTYRTGLRRGWRGEVPSGIDADRGKRAGEDLPAAAASRLDTARALRSLSPAHDRVPRSGVARRVLLRE